MYKILLVFSLVAMTSVFYTNCSKASSGVSQDQGAGGGSSNTLGDVSLLQGTWIQTFCSPAGAGSSAQMAIIANVSSAATISEYENTKNYLASGCPSGTGALNAVSTALGTIRFSSTDLDGASKYFRGVWSPPMTTPTKVIWALRSANVLCIFADSEPTAFPTAASITSYVNTVYSSQFCYRK
jgi:hypothetical protein